MSARRTIFIMILLVGFVSSQSKRDPRSLSMVGAYSTIADATFDLGYTLAMFA